MTSIPTVKEQVRAWVGGQSATKATDGPQREIIAARDLKLLGRVGKSSFATHGGRELRLKGPVMHYKIEEAGADAIVVLQQVRSADGRVRTDTYLATVQEPGTFERLKRQKTYRGPKERARGPMDGLAELRRPADRIPVQLGRSVTDVDRDILLGGLSKRPQFLWTDSRATPMTIRRLVETANAEGANIRRHGEHTLADWTHVRRWRGLLIALWPLVHAHLAGKPLRCAYEHAGEAPPADTFDPAGTPTCNACVGWEPNA